MAKRLMTNDYQSIVFEALNMPENDYYNYYLNIIEDNYRHNHNIIEELKLVLNNYIESYQKIAYGKRIRFRDEKGQLKTAYENQTWDENGRPENLDETVINMNINNKVIRVNKTCFDVHVKILNIIQSSIDLRNKLIEFEKSLPDPIKKVIKGYPMPEGFDYDAIKERYKLLKQTPELIHCYKKEIENLLEPKYNIEFNENQTISEKLNYWKEIIETNVFKPLIDEYGFRYELNFEAIEKEKKRRNYLFGFNKYYTPINIPESIYKKHFQPFEKEPEFTYWFLQYNAKFLCELLKEIKKLPELINSPGKELTIERELSILIEFEKNAEQLYKDNEINIEGTKGYQHKKEIEYIRIKHDYYKTNFLPGVNSGGNVAVEVFAEHVYLKQYLENELDKVLPPQQNENETEQEQPTFINNFDNIQPIEVYKYFKTNLVDKGYLSEPELNEYLKTAFELQTIPETLFKLKHTPIKQNIYTVFYTYYKDIAGKKHEQQTRYVELLGNYFEGYKSNIIKTNWARGYKVKR